jgi:hypothetical protein
MQSEDGRGSDDIRQRASIPDSQTSYAIEKDSEEGIFAAEFMPTAQDEMQKIGEELAKKE